MSAGMIRTVSSHHDRLVQAVADLAGRVVSAAEIKAAYAAAYPDRTSDVQFVIASDHCSNQTNKGACACAMTERALFERIGHGRYRVLQRSSAAVTNTITPDLSLTPPDEGLQRSATVATDTQPNLVNSVQPAKSTQQSRSAHTLNSSNATQRIEVTLISPSDRGGRLGQAKLVFEVIGAAVAVVASILALIWGMR